LEFKANNRPVADITRTRNYPNGTKQIQREKLHSKLQNRFTLIIDFISSLISLFAPLNVNLLIELTLSTWPSSIKSAWLSFLEG